MDVCARPTCSCEDCLHACGIASNKDAQLLHLKPRGRLCVISCCSGLLAYTLSCLNCMRARRNLHKSVIASDHNQSWCVLARPQSTWRFKDGSFPTRQKISVSCWLSAGNANWNDFYKHPTGGFLEGNPPNGSFSKPGLGDSLPIEPASNPTPSPSWRPAQVKHGRRRAVRTGGHEAGSTLADDLPWFVNQQEAGSLI